MKEKFKQFPKPSELVDNLASRIKALDSIEDDNERSLAIDLLRDLADHIVRLPTSITLRVSGILENMREDNDNLEILSTAHRYLREAQTRLPKPRLPRRRR